MCLKGGDTMSEQVLSLKKDKTQVKAFLIGCALTLGASLFLALASRLALPLPGTFVPQTMQTLAVFLIGTLLGKRVAISSIVAYLFEGTCGMPVFAYGASNPLWFLDPKAGFLFGFLLAAYVIGLLLDLFPRKSLFAIVLALCVGQLIIWASGVIVLSFFIGPKAALLTGVFPFIFGAIYKILAAALLARGILLGKLYWSR
jgi:biotin transport system substrate-specific component